MAVNRRYAQTNNILPHAIVTPPDTRTDGIAHSGDPCMLGKIPGVAMADADDTGATRIQRDGIWLLEVDATDDSSGDVPSAVNGGDELFFNASDDPAISKRTGGDHFGYAFGDAGVEMLAAGYTGEILVQVGP